MAVAMLSCCVMSSRSLPPVAVLSYKERLFTLSTKPRVAQRPWRLERCNARAEKSEVKVIVKPQSQWTVSLPLALASVEVVFLAAWIVSVRSIIPSLIFFQGAADVVLSGIMIANCVVGWYALERSRSEIDAPAAPGLMDIAFSLALSFIPLANLFMWLKFAFRQRDLGAKAKASLVANALLYEAPRLLGMMFLFSGGLAVLLGIGYASKLASLLSALHRPMAEARVRNESRIARSQQIISPEEQERIARLKELEEFDTLLARRSSYPVEAKEWSVEETKEWLEEQGFGRYATTFGENDIDGELLLQLTNDDLRDELQILSFGDRKKLEILISQLKRR